MTDDEEFNEDFCDTGPFCRHYSDPSDCEITCATCGHKCPDHGAQDGDYQCGECDCIAWNEPDEIEKGGL